MAKRKLKSARGLPVLKSGMAVRTTLRPFNNPDHEVQAKVTITPGGQIEISVAGYGDATSEDGHGSPILIELGGATNHPLKVIVWSDINKDDPTHQIDMSGALEENRAKA